MFDRLRLSLIRVLGGSPVEMTPEQSIEASIASLRTQVSFSLTLNLMTLSAVFLS